MKRLPWQVKFVRPQVPGKALLRPEVPDVVEITLPLRGPDDDARVVVEREPQDPLTSKVYVADYGTVTVRLGEQELEFVGQAFLQARQEREMERALGRMGR